MGFSLTEERWSRNTTMRSLFFRMKGLTTSMYGSLPPNSTKLAKFCRHLAIMTRDLMAAGGTGSDNRPNDLGDKIAGHNNLRNMNPDTTLVLTSLSLGHLCMTSLCRQAQIYLATTKLSHRNFNGDCYLRVLGQASLDMKIDSVMS